MPRQFQSGIVALWNDHADFLDGRPLERTALPALTINDRLGLASARPLAMLTATKWLFCAGKSSASVQPLQPERPWRWDFFPGG
jgi:hypothetical protein